MDFISSQAHRSHCTVIEVDRISCRDTTQGAHQRDIPKADTALEGRSPFMYFRWINLVLNTVLLAIDRSLLWLRSADIDTMVSLPKTDALGISWHYEYDNRGSCPMTRLAEGMARTDALLTLLLWS